MSRVRRGYKGEAIAPHVWMDCKGSSSHDALARLTASEELMSTPAPSAMRAASESSPDVLDPKLIDAHMAVSINWGPCFGVLI